MSKHSTAAPPLQTAEARRKMEEREKQKQMLDELLLLRKIISESRSFVAPPVKTECLFVTEKERRGGE